MSADAGTGRTMARPGDSDRHRQQRKKNLALAGVIVFVVVMIYVLYLVRQTGAV